MTLLDDQSTRLRSAPHLARPACLAARGRLWCPRPLPASRCPRPCLADEPTLQLPAAVTTTATAASAHRRRRRPAAAVGVAW